MFVSVGVWSIKVKDNETEIVCLLNNVLYALLYDQFCLMFHIFIDIETLPVFQMVVCVSLPGFWFATSELWSIATERKTPSCRLLRVYP